MDTTYWIFQVLKCRNKFRARTLRPESCLPSENDDCYDYHTNEDGSFVDPKCADEDAIT